MILDRLENYRASVIRSADVPGKAESRLYETSDELVGDNIINGKLCQSKPKHRDLGELTRR
jgi:hypothetical protein